MSLGIKDLQTMLDKKGFNPELFEFEVITVPEQGQFIKFKLKRFLGTEQFSKLAKCVQDFGGEYIKGPGAHFRVSRKQESPETPQLEEPSLLSRLEDFYDKLENDLSELEGIIKKIREAGTS